MYKLLNDLFGAFTYWPVDESTHEDSDAGAGPGSSEINQGRLRERRVCVKVKDGLPYTCGDRQRLLEVIQNLLDHAAKFMGKQVKPCIEVGISG